MDYLIAIDPKGGCWFKFPVGDVGLLQEFLHEGMPSQQYCRYEARSQMWWVDQAYCEEVRTNSQIYFRKEIAEATDR